MFKNLYLSIIDVMLAIALYQVVLGIIAMIRELFSFFRKTSTV